MILLARRALTPFALILTAAAVCWWWRTFGEVVGYGYLSWPEAGSCLIRDSDICTLAKALCLGSHPRALIGYAAAVFWVGVALLSVGVLLGQTRNKAPLAPG
jgi:hypothetical protein